MKTQQRYPAQMLAASAINVFGDKLLDLTIIWTLALRSDSILGPALLLAISTLSDALWAIFVGTIVDRSRKLTVMVGACLASTLVIGVFLAAPGVITESVIVATLIIVMNNFISALFGRSFMIAASMQLSTKEFIRFETFATTIDRVLAIAGIGVAGFFVSALSLRTIAMIDIATYITAALILIIGAPPIVKKHPRIPGDGVPEEVGEEAKITSATRSIALAWKEFTKDTRDGLMSVRAHLMTPTLVQDFIILLLVLNLVFGFIPTLLPLVMARDHGDSAFDMSLVRASLTVGEIIGLLFVTRFPSRVSLLFIVSLIGSAVSVGVAGLTSGVLIAVVCLGLYGFFDSISQPLYSFIVTSIDEHERGRVLGGVDAIILIASPVGILIASLMSSVSIQAMVAYLVGIFAIGLSVVLASPRLRSITVD